MYTVGIYRRRQQDEKYGKSWRSLDWTLERSCFSFGLAHT